MNENNYVVMWLYYVVRGSVGITVRAQAKDPLPLKAKQPLSHFILNYCYNSNPLNTPAIGERYYLPKEVFKIWRASNYIYPKSRLPQLIHVGMADEHSFPGRLETKVMISFPGSVSLHPLSTPGTCCLIWEMSVLASGLSIKHNLHL
ncbi:hypothetical protein CEXT_52671 [Caerostris extrusa]|uniref:Uncharacterized protein n=1 Tax=Caerostris extrusa TaxID=172846 RepID=A0AAV4TQG1_CAEEX|nr:hypothetical protein CEXT_52671 [Caerostris extrusa]